MQETDSRSRRSHLGLLSLLLVSTWLTTTSSRQVSCPHPFRHPSVTRRTGIIPIGVGSGANGAFPCFRAYGGRPLAAALPNTKGPAKAATVKPATAPHDDDDDDLHFDRHTISKLALDYVEDCVEFMAKHSTWVRRVLVRGVAGMALLSTGSHFGRVVVVSHTVRVTGWPLFSRAVADITESYRNARAAIKREVRHLKKPTELLSAVRYELKGVRKIMRNAQEGLKDGVLDKDEARETIKQAQVDMKRLEREARVLNAAVDSMAAIGEAFNFSKLRDVLKSLYTATLGCVASGNSVTVGKLSMSFDLGGICCNNMRYLGKSLVKHNNLDDILGILPRETRRLFLAIVGIVGGVQGLVIARALLPRMSLTISSAALGASWVADSIAEVLDPFLVSRDWEPIQGHALYVPIHLGLTYLGWRLQTTRFTQQHPLPKLLQAVLLPLGEAEKRLKKLDGLFRKRI